MPKFRNKNGSQIIEAIKWPGSLTEEIKNFVGDHLGSEPRKNGEISYYVKTIQGNSYILREGDHIIKRSENDFYPNRPTEFEGSYIQI